MSNESAMGDPPAFTSLESTWRPSIARDTLEGTIAGRVLEVGHGSWMYSPTDRFQQTRDLLVERKQNLLDEIAYIDKLLAV